jgi:hypothetical protein
MQNLPNNTGSATGEFTGMSFQDILFIGKVVSDPIVQDGYAFLTLRTYIRVKDANQQWTDTPQDVPIIFDDPNRIENLVEKWIKADRTLLIKAEYKTWGNRNENHGFFVKVVKLGPKGGQQNTTGRSIPQ